MSTAGAESRLSKDGVAPKEREAHDEEEVVMSALGDCGVGGKVKRHGSKPTRKRGAKASKAVTLQHSGTLGKDLGGMQRKPKPRGAGGIDEVIWAGSLIEAKAQVTKEYEIQGELEDYYRDKMCMVGQKLMAAEVHRRCQAIYDYRASKQVYRANRRVQAA